MENEVKQNNFLGTTPIGKLLRMFAIPCVLSLIVQSLYNLVDQIFIGHCDSLGAIGNAATGIVYPLTVIALAIGLWLGDGCAASMSINQGKNDTSKTSKSVGTAISMGIIISLILMIVCFLFKSNILEAIGAKDAILKSSKEYANFIFAGFVFFVLACVLNPIVRADVSPKYAMLAMAIGAIINIVLDPIFIYALDMGMTGAALATFIGQLITFSLHVLYLFKSKTFKINLRDFLPEVSQIKGILKFGVSSFLTQLAIVIISIVNNNLLLAYSVGSGYDTNITQGVITLAFKVFGIVISIVVGIAAGGQPIVGYNYGAKNYDRVKKTLKYILGLTFLVGLIFTLLFEIYPNIFLYIFGNGGEGVDHEVYRKFTFLTFRVYLGFILFTSLLKVIAIFFQSIGFPIKATIISMSRDVIILVPLSVILCRFGGVDSLLWSAPISDSISFVLSIVLLFVAVKNMKSKNIDEFKDEAVSLESRPGVIVTIARMHGASGREIGSILAKRMNVPFYDKEITALTAKETGLSNEFISNVDEGYGKRIYDLYLGLDPTDQARLAQENILKRIANNGSCVIVGRAADYVLKEYKPLRVFIYASKEYRKNQLMNNYGDSEDVAIKNVLASDKKRSSYYKLITGQNWGEKDSYDLMINSEMGIEEVVSIILDAIK